MFSWGSENNPAAFRRVDNRAVRLTAKQGSASIKPIGLTDEQLLTIQRAAAPLHPQDRGLYLEKVAEMLSGHEIGDGLVGRVAREAQRQFLRAPELEPKPVPSQMGPRRAAIWTGYRSARSRSQASMSYWTAAQP